MLARTFSIIWNVCECYDRIFIALFLTLSFWTFYKLLMNIVEAQQPNSTDMEQMKLRTLEARERKRANLWKSENSDETTKKRTASCSLPSSLCCLLPALFCQLIQTVLNLRICFWGPENENLNWDTRSDATNTRILDENEEKWK